MARLVYLFRMWQLYRALRATVKAVDAWLKHVEPPHRHEVF